MKGIVLRPIFFPHVFEGFELEKIFYDNNRTDGTDVSFRDISQAVRELGIIRSQNNLIL